MKVKVADIEIDTTWTIEDVKKHCNVTSFFTTFGASYPDVWIRTPNKTRVSIHFDYDKKTMTDIIEARGDFKEEYLIWKRSFWTRGKNK